MHNFLSLYTYQQEDPLHICNLHNVWLFKTFEANCCDIALNEPMEGCIFKLWDPGWIDGLADIKTGVGAGKSSFSLPFMETVEILSCEVTCIGNSIAGKT